MKVEAVMTTPVLGIEPEASIAEALKLMVAKRISGLPVMRSDGTLVGIVSEGDFLRRAELATEPKRSRWLDFLTSSGKSAEQYVRSHGRRVQEVMSPDVVTIAPDTTLEAAVDLMIQHHIKRLPVVDGGKVAGIVSRSDLLRILLGALPQAEAAVSDDEIRRNVEADLERQTWSHSGLIRVECKDGVVELSGTILDDRERQAARVLAENVAGVKAVKDQLVWVEPISGTVIFPPAA